MLIEVHQNLECNLKERTTSFWTYTNMHQLKLHLEFNLISFLFYQRTCEATKITVNTLQ